MKNLRKAANDIHIFPPGQLPPNNFPNKILQDNYSPEFLPGQLVPTKFPPGKFPPELLLSVHFFLINSPCATTPGQLPLMKFILGQVAMDFRPRQLPLSNLWIVFKTSTVYTSNNFEKELKKIQRGALHATSLKYFILLKSYL